MTKDEYIGKYVGKKMKNNKLPYGLRYLNLVADYEEKAEKYFDAMIRKRLRETLREEAKSDYKKP